MLLVYGAQNSFGVFFKPMISDFGWSRAETAGPFALQFLIGGIGSIIAGSLSDRFGPRKVVAVGGLILSAGYLLTATIHDLWQLYLYYGIIAAAGSSAMYVPVVSLITRWFRKRRGLVSGIGISGIGFGIGVVPLVASHIIAVTDWQFAMLVVGLISLLIVVIAHFLKNAPPDPVSIEKSESLSPSPGDRREFTFRQAAATPQFWMVFASWICYGYFAQLTLVHIVPYASDIGLTAVAAATVLTVIGLVGTPSRILLGLIGDRLGNRITIFAGFAILAVAYIALTASESVITLYLFAAVFGALSGFGILIVPTIAEIYGFRDLGAISGVIVSGYNLGGAISPPLAGAIFDRTQSYEWGFASCALLGLISAFIFWRVKRSAVALPPDLVQVGRKP